jgi:hypothetical protein
MGSIVGLSPEFSTAHNGEIKDDLGAGTVTKQRFGAQV